MEHRQDERDTVEIVNRAEEALLRTRQVARRISARIWRTMEGEPLPGPHTPAAGVLVAEDDGVVRDLLELMLEDLGVPAWSAGDGREAVNVYREHGRAIGAAVLDLHMPNLDGPATLAALRALNPRIGCIFITGQPGDYPEEALRTLGAVVLHKPFTPDQLAADLRPLLQGANFWDEPGA